MICPRCKREAVGWPLVRPDYCSPKDWASCLRNPWDIYQAEEKRLARKAAASSKDKLRTGKELR